MSGDDLSIQLFIASTGIAFAMLGVSQAGWTNKTLVWAMFLLGFVLFVGAVFWGDVRGYAPEVDKLAHRVVGSPWAWPALLVTAFIAVAGLDYRARTKSANHSIAGQPGASPKACPVVPALTIKFEKDGSLDVVRNTSDGGRRRFVRVMVCNTGGLRLSSCTLHIVRFTPNPGNLAPVQLGGRFDIGQDDCNSVDVAEYRERDLSGFNRWPIYLCSEAPRVMPLSGPRDTLSVDHGIQEYEITLEASAPIEKATWVATRVDARLSLVDTADNKQLRLEKV